jgi:hypothetical protein
LTQQESESNIRTSKLFGRAVLKKITFCSFFLLILFSFLFAQEEDLLKVDSSILPQRLSRGEEGKVVLKISVKEAILISPHPSFIIEFNPTNELIFPKNFFTASDLGIETLEEKTGEYLNLQKPITIPFTVSSDATRGSHILEGKVKYFASSRKEGWCLKNTAKFSVTFFTRLSVKKKLPGLF